MPTLDPWSACSQPGNFMGRGPVLHVGNTPSPFFGNMWHCGSKSIMLRCKWGKGIVKTFQISAYCVLQESPGAGSSGGSCAPRNLPCPMWTQPQKQHNAAMFSKASGLSSSLTPGKFDDPVLPVLPCFNTRTWPPYSHTDHLPRFPAP